MHALGREHARDLLDELVPHTGSGRAVEVDGLEPRRRHEPVADEGHAISAALFEKLDRRRHRDARVVEVHEVRPLVHDPAAVPVLLTEPRVLFHRARLVTATAPPDARVLIGVAEQPAVKLYEAFLREQRRAAVRRARDEIDLALLARLQGTEHGLLVFECDQPVRGKEIAGHASSRKGGWADADARGAGRGCVAGA